MNRFNLCHSEEIKTPAVPSVLVTKTITTSTSTSTVPSSRAPPPNREKPRPFTIKPTILTKPTTHDQVS